MSMASSSVLSTSKLSLFNSTLFFSFNVPSETHKAPALTSSLPYSPRKKKPTSGSFNSSFRASAVTSPEVEKQVEEEEEQVADGYSMTQFCDKIIDLFLNEKQRVKEWREYLVFREEWNKYRERFYSRCQTRADAESDPNMKYKLITLASKVRKIDNEMEKHHELLKEIQDSPTDLNAIVTRRRKDFTGEFFRYLKLVSKASDSLEDQDAMYRLATRCLSAVSAFDKTLEHVDTLDTAQAKLDEILDSPSVDVACEKIKSLAKTKELDCSLILLIYSSWAAAKESTDMKNEAKEIMYRLYEATKSSLKSISPKELKLLKHLLNIEDPEERFSALATAFGAPDDNESKDPYASYTTPKELHKWVSIMLDTYHLNKEGTDMKAAKQMSKPIIIQRLLIIKETIEEHYLENRNFRELEGKGEGISLEDW